ncbi:fatty acid synthase-like [Oppia nitens]|uniref:fatty acid synthase-like n=1 Tax=Oppia nitens TaxID=1686743 RepID=UPI0023DB8C54|nr:fatty acid synthase-like [Oppia nitens]
MSDNDIVIAGIGGRFPESETTDEFYDNLYNHTELLSVDDRRYPKDVYGLVNRFGKLKHTNKLDAYFFGFIDFYADTTDSPAKIFLETTYEAMIDAGLCPQYMRGTNTGVYIGTTDFGTTMGIPDELQPDIPKNITEQFALVNGCSRSGYANRISFVFDFKGPSMIIDTACSASLVALANAVNDLELGNCDYAIVGGSNIVTQPYYNNLFVGLEISPEDGWPKVWDENADGYVRGETVASVLLTRRSLAKRVYATVLSAAVSSDGRKTYGMYCPSGEAQEALMIQAYRRKNIDPLRVNYMEAHATGTQAGDLEELKSIYTAFCGLPKRTDDNQLMVGTIKNTIGHCEGASGIVSLIKILLSFERECIPGNLIIETLRKSIDNLISTGLIKPVIDNVKFEPAIACTSNFGLAGVNAIALVEANNKTLVDNRICQPIPRLVQCCGRTLEAITYLMDFIEENPQKITRDFLALFADTVKHVPDVNSDGFKYRGSVIIKHIGNKPDDCQYDYRRHVRQYNGKSVRPVWFLFSGLGGQYPAMARSWMAIPVFAAAIDECHRALATSADFGHFDVKSLLLSDAGPDQPVLDTMLKKFCATVALQIAMCATLESLDIKPDGIIGHSFGEIAAGYADGCLTAREAMIIAYMRGVITENDRQIPRGLMAVVGLSKADAEDKCVGPGVEIICNNGPETVVISGLYDQMIEVIRKLEKDGIFVRQLDSSEIPYHSSYMVTAGTPMDSEIKKYMHRPSRMRSNKWLSTSFSDKELSDMTVTTIGQHHNHQQQQHYRTASPEYYAHNLCSPVYFYDRIQKLPADAIFIELSPHSLFANIIHQSMGPTVSVVSLMNENYNDADNLDLFLSSIGTLYELGLNPSIENLYPKVVWPVARGTQSIGSLMRWDHSADYLDRTYPQYFNRYTASDLNFPILLNDMSYLRDHCLDGRCIFPATGFLSIAWRQFAASLGRTWEQVPVHFRNVIFKKMVNLVEDKQINLKCRYLDSTGDFSITYDGDEVCCGQIRSPDDNDDYYMDSFMPTNEDIGSPDDDDNEEEEDEEVVVMTQSDIYKDYKCCGYDFGDNFQRLRRLRTRNFRQFRGQLDWSGNMITYLDSLLQSVLVEPVPGHRRLLIRVPVEIRSIKMNMSRVYAAVKRGRYVLDTSSGTIGATATTTALIPPNIQRRYHMYTARMPFRTDLAAKLIVADGICVENWTLETISRRPTETEDLVLDSYEFVANDDSSAIGADQRLEIANYIEICKYLATKIKINGLTKMLCDYNYKQYSRQAIDDYRQQQQLCSVGTGGGGGNKLLDTNRIMFTVLDQMSTLIDNRQPKMLDTFVQNLLETGGCDLSRDLINTSVADNQRLIRTLVDIVAENLTQPHPPSLATGHKKQLPQIKVTEINLTNSPPVTRLVYETLAYSRLHYPVQVDYKLVTTKTGSSVVHEPTIVQLIGGQENLIQWSQWSEWSKQQHQHNDLVVFRDSPELWELDVMDFLRNLTDIINDRGFLLAIFRNNLAEPERSLLSLTTTKTNLTDNHLTGRIDQFCMIAAAKFGLKQVARKYDTIVTTALLFRKLDSTRLPDIPDPNRVIIMSGGGGYDDMFDRVQQTLATASSGDGDDKLWLIANDTDNPVINGGAVGFFNSLRHESDAAAGCIDVSSLRYICQYNCPTGGDGVVVDDNNNNGKHTIIDFNREPYDRILSTDLVMNVIKDGIIGTYRHIGLDSGFDTVWSNDYYLKVDKSYNNSSEQPYNHQWIKLINNNITYNNTSNDSQIDSQQCYVYYAGLIGHDAFISSAVSCCAATPTTAAGIHADDGPSIGYEFVGRRLGDGQRVMGFDHTLHAIATRVDIRSDHMAPVPDKWSMLEAITALAGYCVAWYGLVDQANIKQGSSILVHSPTSEFGLAIINVAKHYGADIYVTHETAKQKQYLMTELKIPESRVLDINTNNNNKNGKQFYQYIRRQTSGRGVQIVFNTLTDESGVHQTYDCLADCGHFLDCSQSQASGRRSGGHRSIPAAAAAAVHFMRNVRYVNLNVYRVAAAEAAAVAKQQNGSRFFANYFEWLNQNISDNDCSIRPLNTIIYTKESVDVALRDCMKGDLIGKFVIKMRDEELDDKLQDMSLNNNNNNNNMLVKCVTKFNSNKVYIITGGLGGFGLELVQWMAGLGAKRFVLTTRYGLRSDYQKAIVKRLESIGGGGGQESETTTGRGVRLPNLRLLIVTHDCNTEDGARQLLADALTLGPLGGLFHLSLVVNDCLFTEMSKQQFTESVDCKYKQFDHLDRLTRETLAYRLDYFVLFSSLACGKGNPGQTNYSYGNSMCERLCEQRRRRGEHALAIQWGFVGDVGYAAELLDRGQLSSLSSSIIGTVSRQRIHQCLNTLDRLLQCKQPIVTSYVRTPLSNIREQQLGNKSSNKSSVIKYIWRALGIDPKYTDIHTTMGQIGIESLLAIEMIDSLKREFGLRLTMQDLKWITVKHLLNLEVGDTEHLANYLTELTNSRQRLRSVQFMIGTDRLTKLNNSRTGRPVYIVPGLECNFTAFAEMIDAIDRPVYGLNWTTELNQFRSLDELNDYFMKTLNELSPDGDRHHYDLILNFDGNLLAADLYDNDDDHHHHHRQAIIDQFNDRLVYVDVITHFMANLKMDNDNDLLYVIFLWMCFDIPDIIKQKIYKTSVIIGGEQQQTIDCKIGRLSAEIRKFVGKSFVSQDMEQMIANAYKRLKLWLQFVRSQEPRDLMRLKRTVQLETDGKLLCLRPVIQDEIIVNYIDYMDKYYLSMNLPVKFFKWINQVMIDKVNKFLSD